jgi:hypothetical protein
MAGTLDGGKIVQIFIQAKKSIMPIIEIVFPRSIYLFHCTIPNNAGGGKTTFAIAFIHHQNSSKT